MSKESSCSATGTSPRTLRILCADDDRVIRDILRLALTRDGHQVTTVDDGSHAH